MQESILYPLEWGTPLLLDEKPLKPWPRDVFPEPIESFVQELSRSSETPLELSALLALSVLATASHKKFQVQIKDGYCEPINIWTLTVLPPASRKTAVFKEITKPLRQWEAEKKEQLEPLVKSAESAQKTMDVSLKGLRQQAAKIKNPEELQKLQFQIEEAEANVPKLPTFPQIWTSDVTNEQLGVIMAANGEGMGLLNDEGGIFDVLSGLYSEGRSNIDLYLQAHAGSPVRVDRGSRPPIFMERAVLTMGFAVQPLTVKKVCANKTYRGRGLLGRFLYVVPKSNIGYRTLEAPPMLQEHREAWAHLIKALLHRAHTSEENKEIYTLYLTEEAHARWLEHAKGIETMMCEEMGYLTHIADWAGKLSGAIARMAALLHIARYAHQNPCSFSISFKDMDSAVKIGHMLISHALFVFDQLLEDEEQGLARKLCAWIKQEKLTSFTRRDASRKFRQAVNELPAALLLLEQSEIIRKAARSSATGRPSDRYEVNPELIKD